MGTEIMEKIRFVLCLKNVVGFYRKRKKLWKDFKNMRQRPWTGLKVKTMISNSVISDSEDNDDEDDNKDNNDGADSY